MVQCVVLFFFWLLHFSETVFREIKMNVAWCLRTLLPPILFPLSLPVSSDM